jgi:tryptophan 2,3-dioxygenase
MNNKNIEAGNENSIHKDFSGEMSYSDYLNLNKILSSQNRLTDHHDEMLFIIIHQTSELWMKQILHEITAATEKVNNGQIEKALKILSRVTRIQQQLIQSWDVLSTLTPSEYLEFREKLGRSSGFQSYQNRLIEFALGYKSQRALAVFEHQSELHTKLVKALNEPSIYDGAIQCLNQAGLAVDQSALQRDWTQNYQPNESVERAWLTVYQNVDQYWNLYELAEKLLDIEFHQQQWRLNHMFTVERIIGNKMGTGGSSGVQYLKRVLDHRFFPELLNLRTTL